jgi:D-beta-D-heptose 7-phosphate kinase / D-beta-D-heptose 1-phosphate adenosyltransferase
MAMTEAVETFLQSLGQSEPVRLLCVGDVMIDRYVYGHVARISPEAPIPVVKYARETAMPGAAANVARNAAAMGAEVTLLAPVGDDTDADAFEALLSATEGLQPALVRQAGASTIIKTRFVAGGQQVMRLDREGAPESWAGSVPALVSALEAETSKVSAVLVSDYAKGAITAELMSAIIAAARKTGALVIIDPKVADWSVYGVADLIKPNAAELAQATGLPTRTDEEVEAALRRAGERFPARRVLVTRADKGMSYVADDGAVRHHRGKPVEVFDVSGAGDTSLAAIGLALAHGADLATVAAFATLASRIAVTKRGTAVVGLDEIRAGLGLRSTNRAGDLSLEAARRQVKAWRAEGLKVGFTNGCFDILHVGHLKVIEEARARCDRLVLGLNSDASVKRLKGPTRPVNDEADRARLLAGLAAVDAVVVFAEDTPIDLIRALEPDLLVKGGDYSPETIVGYGETVARGGEVHIVPLEEGRSTTSTIERLQKT